MARQNVAHDLLYAVIAFVAAVAVIYVVASDLPTRDQGAWSHDHSIVRNGMVH